MTSHSIVVRPDLAIPMSEVGFEFARSGGPGGQNVNKVSTKVELRFHVGESSALSSAQKARILRLLSARIGKDGVLRVASQESRSQWRNREMAIGKFASLIAGALAVQRPRHATRPTATSRERRFGAKKRRSDIKRRRGRIGTDE